MLCTGIFGGSDLQNPYSKDGIMSGKSMHGAAFAYETVRAVTVIPEDKKEKEEFKAVTTNRHYDRGAVVKGYAIPEDKKEFTIPNPLDEITLRKIRETEQVRRL